MQKKTGVRMPQMPTPNDYALIILAIAALLGAIYAIISHSKKFILWDSNRKKRREKLDMLIDNAENIKCTDETRERVDILVASVEDLRVITEKNIDHNRMQDKEIERSLKQRQVQDMALFALLDERRKQGKNGPITEAYGAMKEYMLSENSKPYTDILKKGD